MGLQHVIANSPSFSPAGDAPGLRPLGMSSSTSQPSLNSRKRCRHTGSVLGVLGRGTLLQASRGHPCRAAVQHPPPHLGIGSNLPAWHSIKSTETVVWQLQAGTSQGSDLL